MSGVLCVYNESGVRQDLPGYLAALRRLSHRGPDGEGSVLRDNLFVGVRRSSVGRGSEGEQPSIGRDPLGVRTLYYYRSARHFVGASEIKSII